MLFDIKLLFLKNLIFKNSCIDKFLNENEDLMNKRFELELNILKDLHTNYKNERMQKEFSILNQSKIIYLIPKFDIFSQLWSLLIILILIILV